MSVLADAVHTIGANRAITGGRSTSGWSVTKMFMGKMAAELAAAALMMGMVPILAASVATAGPCDPGTMGPDPLHPFPACESCVQATVNDPYHRACYGGAPASVPPRNTPPSSTVPVKTAQAPPPTYAPPSTMPVQAAPPPALAPSPAPAAAPPAAPATQSPLCSGTYAYAQSNRFFCADSGGADLGNAAAAPAPPAAPPNLLNAGADGAAGAGAGLDPGAPLPDQGPQVAQDQPQPGQPRQHAVTCNGVPIQLGWSCDGDGNIYDGDGKLIGHAPPLGMPDGQDHG